MAEETTGADVDDSMANTPSPDVPTSNGVNGVHSTDPDGDVHMDQSPTTNGHANDIPRHSPGPPTSRATSNFDSPQHAVDDDDEVRQPPAKRARKFSDADQASLANVSIPVVVRLYRRADFACLLSYPHSSDPEDWLSPSCYSVLYANQW